jgi:hypothetical protein
MNGNKRVFLVTDHDEPPGSGSTRQAARTTFGVSPAAKPVEQG